MRKILLITITLVFFYGFIFSQQQNFSSKPGAIVILKTGNHTSGKVDKSACNLYKKPLLGDILLFSGELIKNKLINFSFNSNSLEIKLDNDSIGYISGHQVKEFNFRGLINAYYVNGARYSGAPYPVKIYEVLSEGKFELVKLFYKETLQSNYNIALNVGSKSSKGILKSKLYYYDGSSLKDLKRSRKQIMKIFKDHQKDIEKLIDKENLSVRKEHDLIRVFDFYNKQLSNN